MLNEHPPDGARLSLEVVRGQASAGRSPQTMLLASLRPAFAVETLRNSRNRKFPIDYREQMRNMRRRSRFMLIIDPAMLIALAAIISSLSALVWAVRRKP